MWSKLESFFLTPTSAKPLGVLRIGLATVLLLQVWMLHGQFFDLYSSGGILQQAVGEGFSRGPVFQPTEITRSLTRIGLSEKTALITLGGSYILSLIFLLLGLFTRSAAIVAWGLHLIFGQGHFTGYGVDLFAHFALFYAIFMPMGATYSIDSLRHRALPSHSWQSQLSLRVWQIHLSIAYLSTGIEKAMGEQWRNGEAIWRSLMLPTYRQMDFGWLASLPWLALVLAWGTLAIEIGYPFLIFPRRTRPVWVALTVSLHVGIGLFMGLHLFALLMALLTFCCFGLAERSAPIHAIP